MGNGFDSQFRMARNNVNQIKKAITETPKDQLEGMTWLVTNMQEEDLRTLSADFFFVLASSKSPCIFTYPPKGIRENFHLVPYLSV